MPSDGQDDLVFIKTTSGETCIFLKQTSYSSGNSFVFQVKQTYDNHFQTGRVCFYHLVGLQGLRTRLGLAFRFGTPRAQRGHRSSQHAARVFSAGKIIRVGSARRFCRAICGDRKSAKGLH